MGSFETLENLTTDSENLELEVISKSKNHHLNYTGMDYYGLQRVSK
jgi:hypothetical protein